MYNKVILIGNLTRDVELKYTQTGTAVGEFGLAVNRIYIEPTTKEKKEEVMFIDIVVFGRAAETANQYIKKGSQILVEGRLVLNQWTDQMGQKRSKHKVVAENIRFLKGNDSESSKNYAQPQSTTTNNVTTSETISNTTQNNVLDLNMNEEDIPF